MSDDADALCNWIKPEEVRRLLTLNGIASPESLEELGLRMPEYVAMLAKLSRPERQERGKQRRVNTGKISGWYYRTIKPVSGPPEFQRTATSDRRRDQIPASEFGIDKRRMDMVMVPIEQLKDWANAMSVLHTVLKAAGLAGADVATQMRDAMLAASEKP